MNTNLTFTYEAAALFDLIDAETSRLAAFLRFKGGASAYDALKIHTNDRPTIEGFVSEAIDSVLSKFEGESKHVLEEGEHTISFYLPDFDNDRHTTAEKEIRDFIVHSATARWLLNRSFPEPTKIEASNAESSLNRAIGTLRTRKIF